MQKRKKFVNDSWQGSGFHRILWSIHQVKGYKRKAKFDFQSGANPCLLLLDVRTSMSY
jgi:hypothetical protein